MELDKTCKNILNIVGIYSNYVTELEGIFFSREQLLSEIKYNQIKEFIPELKKFQFIFYDIYAEKCRKKSKMASYKFG